MNGPITQINGSMRPVIDASAESIFVAPQPPARRVRLALWAASMLTVAQCAWLILPWASFTFFVDVPSAEPRGLVLLAYRLLVACSTVLPAALFGLQFAGVLRELSLTAGRDATLLASRERLRLSFVGAGDSSYLEKSRLRAGAGWWVIQFEAEDGAATVAVAIESDVLGSLKSGMGRL